MLILSYASSYPEGEYSRLGAGASGACYGNPAPIDMFLDIVSELYPLILADLADSICSLTSERQLADRKLL
jgi:hypothetical protein